MTQRNIKNGIGVIVALGAVGFIMFQGGSGFLNQAPSSAGSGGEVLGSRAMSVQEYISQNISEISPVKEQLGGKFYVTNIEAGEGTGTVSYEDGHNAYVADFTYSTDENTGAITVNSFTVR